MISGPPSKYTPILRPLLTNYSLSLYPTLVSPPLPLHVIVGLIKVANLPCTLPLTRPLALPL